MIEDVGLDPLTLVAVSVVLCAVSLLACWGPARRALRVDPRWRSGPTDRRFRHVFNVFSRDR